MSEILQKCAEILVDCGYATNFRESSVHNGYFLSIMKGFDEILDPFADTLDGRRQLDAIEDWLMIGHYARWVKSENIDTDVSMKFSCQQWRLDRIKWCIGELVK